MAPLFIVMTYFAIDMCLGNLVMFLWHKLCLKKDELMVAVASGLICGEGFWILPASVLALAKIIKPPICMKFVPS
ncbi:hypothetical protein MLD38_006898 [Melastoma candidum]|uniref:Uncharacterized protein n=1 Tax=Melastoma candidum TaxID=119954 RepID=A0ACB9RPH3_9MYRT|nr:hypothetical protein MLD38_006898 [Melastoma candidum]